jgi:hypothetical protein
MQRVRTRILAVQARLTLLAASVAASRAIDSDTHSALNALPLRDC